MPGASVTVSVDRDGCATLQATTSTVETRRSFDLVLRGHDGPTHVHCKLEGDLADVARLERPNYYVEPGTETVVPVAVDDLAERVEGTLEVSTGYGATAVEIDVAVGPDRRVAVDERLSAPPDREPAPTYVDQLAGRLRVARRIDPSTLGVLALAAVAVAAAILTASVVDGPAALVGLLIVTVGVGVAVSLLLG